MPLARTRHRLLALLVGVGLPAAALVAVTPASADVQEGVTLTVDEPIVEKEYPPIVGQDPVTVTIGEPLQPPDCAIAPSCHLVTVDIVVPELEQGDDFLVDALIDWDYNTGAEDLDIYLWDDQQTKKAEGSSGYTEVSSAASANHPETFSVFNPTLGRYNLTVNNWSGANIGWRLSMEMTVLKFTRPFESLAPSARRSPPPPSSGPSTGSPSPAPSRQPTGPAPAPTTDPVTGEVAAPPSLTTADVGEDADFSSGQFADDSDFDDELAAPVLPTPGNAIANRGADPPSTAALLVWFVGVPIVALVGFGFLLTRRNPGMLRAALPRRRSRTAEA